MWRWSGIGQKVGVEFEKSVTVMVALVSSLRLWKGVVAFGVGDRDEVGKTETC